MLFRWGFALGYSLKDFGLGDCRNSVKGRLDVTEWSDTRLF